jgi:serine protease
MKRYLEAMIVGPALFITNPSIAGQCIDHYQHLAEASAMREDVGLPRAPRLSDIRAGLVARDYSGKPVAPYLRPRPATIRPHVEGLERQLADALELVVKFNDDTLATAVAGTVTLPDPAGGANLRDILVAHPQFAFQPTIKGGDDWLTAIRFCAADNTGQDFADLTSFFSAPIHDGNRKGAVALLKRLLAHPSVETAWLRGPAMAPALDILPPTPAFDVQQRHLDAAPNGINLRSAWASHFGTRGANLRYADIEFAWRFDHEDFPAIIDGRTLFRQAPTGHGTAVVGVLSAVHNTFGTHGGIPGSEVHVADDENALAQLRLATLRAGDAAILEMAFRDDPKGWCATTGDRAAVPMERDDAIFAQIQQLVANGVVFFEPAGNDSLDLDDPCWGGELTRGGRDSGAILVAAGDVVNCGPNATATLTAAAFSSFGTRIDANGWGRCVTTTGYNADLFAPDGDERQFYTETFDGTSSATPVVMAAAMALQGWQKARTGRTYNSLTMRSILQRLGTPTTGPRFIARQPDVGATLTWLVGDDDGDGIVNGDELSLGQNLIDHYYQAILGRPAEPGGKIFWLGEIERMRSLEVDPREAYRALAKTFFLSAEYLARNRTDNWFVEDLYQTFYQRPGDPGGSSYWTGLLASGLARESALTSFMFAPEFDSFMNLQLTGNPQGQRGEVSIIINAYRGAFARLPDTGGFTYYRSLLRSAICQRSWSAVYNEANNVMWGAFFLSPEYWSRAHSNAQYVSDLYDAVLSRGADLAGQQHWVNQMIGGMQAATVLGNFLSSAEWASRVTAVTNQACIP